MSIESVRAALEAALNALSPPIQTAWENVPYTPADGVAFQRVTLIPASPGNDEISRSYVERGVFQITLAYPPGNGPRDAAARAELIRAAFYRGRSLVNGGLTVTIERTPEIGVGQIDPNGRWVVPVRLRYMAPVAVS
jgi:hypothetical protein